MEFSQFKQLANGDPVVFLTAWNLLLENGGKFLRERTEADLLSSLEQTLSGFFAAEKLREIVKTAKALAILDTGEFLDFIQLSDRIIQRPTDDREGVCPVCGLHVAYLGDDMDHGELHKRWECPGCNATGKEVRYWRFALHRDVRTGDGKLYFPRLNLIIKQTWEDFQYVC